MFPFPLELGAIVYIYSSYFYLSTENLKIVLNNAFIAVSVGAFFVEILKTV